METRKSPFGQKNNSAQPDSIKNRGNFIGFQNNHKKLKGNFECETGFQSIH
jgi:hypothetical protein